MAKQRARCFSSRIPHARCISHLTPLPAPLCAAIGTLLETCRTACEDVTPLIEAVYAQLGKDGAVVRKEDMSHFSLADGVVQVCLFTPDPECECGACLRMKTHKF